MTQVTTPVTTIGRPGTTPRNVMSLGMKVVLLIMSRNSKSKKQSKRKMLILTKRDMVVVKGVVAMVDALVVDLKAEISIFIPSGDHFPKLTKCADTKTSHTLVAVI